MLSLLQGLVRLFYQELHGRRHEDLHGCRGSGLWTVWLVFESGDHSNHHSIDWLIDWSINCQLVFLIDWLIDWFVADRSFDWLIDWLIHWMTTWLRGRLRKSRHFTWPNSALVISDEPNAAYVGPLVPVRRPTPQQVPPVDSGHYYIRHFDRLLHRDVFQHDIRVLRDTTTWVYIVVLGSPCCLSLLLRRFFVPHSRVFAFFPLCFFFLLNGANRFLSHSFTHSIFSSLNPLRLQGFVSCVFCLVNKGSLAVDHCVPLSAPVHCSFFVLPLSMSIARSFSPSIFYSNGAEKLPPFTLLKQRIVSWQPPAAHTVQSTRAPAATSCSPTRTYEDPAV